MKILSKKYNNCVVGGDLGAVIKWATAFMAGKTLIEKLKEGGKI